MMVTEGESKVMNNRQGDREHDEKVLREGDLILSEVDLRELINTTYAGYHYKSTQLDKLTGLIDFLARESNRYRDPALAAENEKLSNYLNNLRDFLTRNFHAGAPADNGEAIYCFNTEETSAETEAFLMEFQVVALEVERGYRNYRAAVMRKLQSA
jgi:hypothetical protein